MPTPEQLADQAMAFMGAQMDAAKATVVNPANRAKLVELLKGATAPPPPPPPTTLPPREVIFVSGPRGREITSGGGMADKPVTIENVEYVYTGSPTVDSIGISIVGKRPTVTLRNVVVKGFRLNVAVQGYDGPIGALTLEDTLLTDAGIGGNEKSNGLYVSRVSDIALRRSAFFDNGAANILSHNAYIQGDCGPATVTDCTFAGAGSHGIQLRGGGSVTGCVFDRNPIGLSFGGGNTFVPGGVSATALGNVFLRGSDIAPEHLRGWGIWCGNVKDGTLAHNLFANADGVGHNTAALVLDASDEDDAGSLGVGVRNLAAYDNLKLRWADVYKPGVGPAGSLTGTTVAWLPPTAGQLAANLYTPLLAELLTPTLPRPSAALYCAAMRQLLGMAA